MIYSLVGACMALGINPEEWLIFVAENISDWPNNRIEELLPQNFYLHLPKNQSYSIIWIVSDMGWPEGYLCSPSRGRKLIYYADLLRPLLKMTPEFLALFLLPHII